MNSSQALQANVLNVLFNVDWGMSLVDEDSVKSRVEMAIRFLVRMAHNHEPFMRTFLMLSMHHWLHTRPNGKDSRALRKRRRLMWLDRALAPLGLLPPRQKRRLGTALSMLCGVEAMIVTKDVFGCTAREAEDASRWAAQAVLRAAMEEPRGRD